MSRVTVTDAGGGLRELRLTRPEARNAIDPEWVADFGAAVAECADARAVLITAEGPAFSVGGDLAHFQAHDNDLSGALEAMVPDFHRGLLALAEQPPPVVCAVNGAAAGGALGLLWCSDLVVVSEDARFATGFHLLGLSGDGGSGWWLPRLVGLRRAQEMLIGGRVLDAATALDWGLVTEVVAADALEDRAHDLARGLADGPAFSLSRTRALLRESPSLTLGEHYQAETDAMLACGETADAVEGVAAFAEKRAPRFGA